MELTEYGIAKEQIDTFVNVIAQGINVLKMVIETYIEAINAIVENLNELIEHMQEQVPEYFNQFTNDQIIKYAISIFIEKIYKRKEPP